MKKKLLYGGIVLLTLLQVATALSLTSQVQSMDVAPGDSVIANITVENASHEVRVENFGAFPGIEASPEFLNNSFYEGDTFKYRILIAEDLSQGVYNSTVFTSEYNETGYEVNSTNFTTELVYDRPLQLQFNQSVRNQTVIKMNDFSFELQYDNSSNIRTDMGSEDLTGCESFTERCSFRFNDTDYKLQSQGNLRENGSLEIFADREQKVKAGRDIVKIRKVNPLEEIKRGQDIRLESYNSRTGETVPRAKVEFKRGNSNFEDLTSQPNGRMVVSIPEKFRQDKLRYNIYLVRQDGLTAGSGELELMDWQDFRKMNKLELSSLPSSAKKGGGVNGVLKSVNGSYVPNAFVEVRYNGQRQKVAVNDSLVVNFTVPYSLQHNSTVEIQGIYGERGFDYLNSNTTELRIIGDSDGDGLLNPEDNCPFEKGVIENQGCPKVELISRLYEYNPSTRTIGEEVNLWGMKPDEEYQLRLENHDGEVMTNISGDIEIIDSREDGKRDVRTLENGVINFAFADYGGHEVRMDTSSAYTDVREVLYVPKNGSGLPVFPFFVLLVLSSLGVMGYAVYNKDSRFWDMWKPWVNFLPDAGYEVQGTPLETEKFDQK